MSYRKYHNPYMEQRGVIQKIFPPRIVDVDRLQLPFIVYTKKYQEKQDHPTLYERGIRLMCAVYEADAIEDFLKRFKVGDWVVVQADIEHLNYYCDEEYDYMKVKGIMFNAYRIRKIDEKTWKPIKLREHRRMVAEEEVKENGTSEVD